MEEMGERSIPMGWSSGTTSWICPSIGSSATNEAAQHLKDSQPPEGAVAANKRTRCRRELPDVHLPECRLRSPMQGVLHATRRLDPEGQAPTGGGPSDRDPGWGGSADDIYEFSQPPSGARSLPRLRLSGNCGQQQQQQQQQQHRRTGAEPDPALARVASEDSLKRTRSQREATEAPQDLEREGQGGPRKEADGAGGGSDGHPEVDEEERHRLRLESRNDLRRPLEPTTSPMQVRAAKRSIGRRFRADWASARTAAARAATRAATRGRGGAQGPTSQSEGSTDPAGGEEEDVDVLAGARLKRVLSLRPRVGSRTYRRIINRDTVRDTASEQEKSLVLRILKPAQPGQKKQLGSFGAQSTRPCSMRSGCTSIRKQNRIPRSERNKVRRAAAGQQEQRERQVATVKREC